MENRLTLIESMNAELLKEFTIFELQQKQIFELNFEWKFNKKNSNVFPVLDQLL